jgi:hypothetical protein
MSRRPALAACIVVLPCALSRCAPAGPAERTGVRRAPLAAPLAEAFCVAQVEGLGAIDTETDYLPHVVACENGGAGTVALEVQAIAARSVLYWEMGTHGSICDGQGCQVYSCAAAPGPEHHAAVAATSGKYLAYNGNVTYAFYVNGDKNTAPPACVGDPAAQNEKWITYNAGKSGTDVEQTTLGFVFDPSDAGYGQNRGCMGQWGSRCLEAAGVDRDGILRFYYGEDIELLQALGPCVTPDPGSGGAGGDGAGGGVGSIAAAGVGGATGEGGGGGAGGGGEAPAGAGEGLAGGCGCRLARAPGTAPAPWVALLCVLFGGRRVTSRSRRRESSR